MEEVRAASHERIPVVWLVVYAAIQIALPLRARLYGGNPLWHEQGYRFGWNVMLMEKLGSADFWLVDRRTGTRRSVRLRDYLTRSQEKALATQPDMIVAFAQKLARAERVRGRDVAVYADIFVVLNGRPSARLVDPQVDLGKEQDSLGSKAWILPAPP
jgi:vitamin K-dependent gamma-carboxylase